MDELREEIDRLVRSGGRLTVEGAVGAVVVLEQPGSRFGILEVRALLTIPSGDDAGLPINALSSGWADPTVTHRLGREIRLHPAEFAADRPLVRTRVWRVPPTLASELADEVRAALGVPARIDYQALAIREPRAVPASPHTAQPAPPAAEEHEELADDRPARPRLPRPVLPAPVRAVLVVVLVAVVGFVWAGMIRGAPRQPSSAAGTTARLIAGGPPGPTSPRPSIATPSPSATVVPFRAYVVDVSTEEANGRASAAVDGNPMTAWHAAFGIPQWIEVAFEAPSTVSEITLLITQSERGMTRHMIQVARTGAAPELVGVVGRETADGDAFVFRPEAPIEGVERIRIETLASPSNAGWYEVIVR